MRSVRSLTYGITSSLTLVEADGTSFVLRCYDRAEGPDTAEEHVENEVRALAVAGGVLGSLVPQLVAADPVGVEAGRPSLLMTCLSGEPVIFDVDLDQMAEIMTTLHASPVPTDLEPARPWFDAARLHVPSWSRRPDAWTQLLTVLDRPPPPAPPVFLHRDFHHGNLLWTEGRITGVVDWPSGCVGARAVDLAHTRTNLALVNGVEAADRFLGAYVARVPAFVQEIWWDAGALVGLAQDFAGLLAFNVFGAALTHEQLAANADRYAEALVR